jgi:hypothetical protein
MKLVVGYFETLVWDILSEVKRKFGKINIQDRKFID